MFGNKTINEKGVTLIEILASIILISILIVSFLALFSTSAKQNKESEEVMDATYVAQKYIEKISNLSRNSSLDDIDIEFEDKRITTNNSTTVVEFQEGKFNTVLVIDRLDEYNTSKVRVEVLEKGKTKAFMETIVWWRGTM